MSMSQEEIEALMNGLDIVEEETVESPVNELVSEDEIENLIASSNEEIEEVSNKEPVSNDDIDDLLKGLESNEVDVESENDNFDDILSEIDFSSDVEDKIEIKPEVIEEIEEEVIEKVNPVVVEEKKDIDKDEIGRDWTDGKVKEGVLPLPVDSDSKVVNQLTQVANDSEENVSKIFDVLSDILDNNNYLQNNLNSQSDFLSSQIKLLQSMNTKFPEIDIFKTNLDKASILESEMKDLITNIDNKNMQIFEAMELMQFNDINRQKIERVMSVIKKLSNYLSNLFEDESNAPEVSVAKHIHGDKEHDLAGDDLDSLINEFGK